jgi:AbrB family looped-hinge helix DNA binding protein
MQVLEKTVKVSSKGQITLPRKVRELLASDYVRIVLEDGHVHLEAARDAAGMLSKYGRRFADLGKAKDRGWTEAVREKHGRR